MANKKETVQTVNNEVAETKAKQNFRQQLIFELTHCYGIAKAKSLKTPDANGHFIYECTMRKSGNVVKLHVLIDDNHKAVLVEPNANMTLKDYEVVNKLGQTKIVEKIGMQFESDEIVVNGTEMKLVQRKDTMMNEKVEVKAGSVRTSKLEKLKAKLEKIAAQTETLEAEYAAELAKTAA